jgi:hypothetical protein
VIAGDRYERIRSPENEPGVSAQDALLAWYTSAAPETGES